MLTFLFSLLASPSLLIIERKLLFDTSIFITQVPKLFKFFLFFLAINFNFDNSDFFRLSKNNISPKSLLVNLISKSLHSNLTLSFLRDTHEKQKKHNNNEIFLKLLYNMIFKMYFNHLLIF